MGQPRTPEIGTELRCETVCRCATARIPLSCTSSPTTEPTKSGVRSAIAVKRPEGGGNLRVVLADPDRDTAEELERAAMAFQKGFRAFRGKA